MPTIQLLNPIDQPSGSFRLLDWLNNNFLDTRFDNFKCLVAFAKIRPFYKLHTSIQSWNLAGKKSSAIIGIDHKGTSDLALQYCLSNFNETYVIHANHSTFHPKIYIFYGKDSASIFYGSNNLTPGGLETNFEGGILLNLTLPADSALLNQALASFNELLPPTMPCTSPLTSSLLSTLKSRGMLLDETIKTAPPTSHVGSTSTGTAASTPVFAPYAPKPAKAIPKSVVQAASASAGLALSPVTPAATTTPVSSTPVIPSTIPLLVTGLIIQVIPHHNGEILLSKIAVNQNPSFWGFPFTGSAVPKKVGNPSYPQRVPDPIVNIYVHDSTGTLINTELKYNLNMVYYDKKSEIRITITPSILAGLGYSSGPNYPIMVIKESSIAGCDYDLLFYANGSTDYTSYLSVCNQSLPSGGLPVSRKMGWI